jgi:mannose-1-phosphate guanylyltransferase / mannose-6-phosphate isomerase
MAIYPVIMCGGSGVRLWPASRPGRPKQFTPLVGEYSSFQNTVRRVAAIPGAAEPVIVAGVSHAERLRSQLAGVGLSATLLLEPEARDSAAAMAAAAAFVAARDPQGVLVVVAADHHIPDDAAFRAAVIVAARAAMQGAIVTLGVKPTFPSTAYGYIRAGTAGGEVRPVLAFVEKPDEATAAAHVAAGYLWNSGNFIVRADRLLEELAAHAPAVRTSAQRAVAEMVADGRLGESFRAAPKISIDYAVMEKTDRAAVLPVDFAWSDLGAWDAILAASDRDDRGMRAWARRCSTTPTAA